MDIQLAQLIAATELRSIYTRALALKLLRRYAIVELKMLYQAKQFALDFERKPIIEESDQAQLDRFYTWYYINYVVGSKNGLLTIETAMNISFFQFFDLPEYPDQKRHYVSYAKVELNMNEESAVEYANKLLNSQDTGADDNFCLWFYINQVVKKQNLR